MALLYTALNLRLSSPMNRSIATNALAFFGLITFAAGCAGTQEGAREAPPNVIFIMADDLGYGDLGSYGQAAIQTPHLDALAAQGTRFTDVYAGSPVCAPSRSVLLTGQHAGHTTVRGNFGVGGVRGLGGGEGRVPLRAEDVTVAEVLHEAGYVTGITGKWGLGEPETTGTPLGQGFDEWFGYLNQRRAHSYYPDFLWRGDERVPLPGNADGGRETYSHDLFTDFALDFVRRHGQGERPFFLYLPYTIPHDDYEIPELEPYVDASWTADEQVHASMVTRLDRDIGRLLDVLDELDIADETIIFFTSDNGAAQRWEGRFDSSGDLRGRKRDLYEGGIRVPMLVRWPRHVPAGATDDTPWYFPDVLPTLADLAGMPVPDGVDGVSVLPTLLGQEQPALDERPMYWEFYERGFQQAVRQGDWKAVKLAPDADWELYDLAEDPAERANVAAEHPDVVERLAAFAERSHVPSLSWPLEAEAGS